MKIRLIDPAPKDNLLMQTNKDIKSYWFARLSLTTIAALTPPEIEVAITDENVEEIDFNEDVDLVGLTAMTMHAVRAYEIADRFRERNIPVVMGGLHASSLPEEAKQHVDAVVIGEAEGVWKGLLEDFQGGRLQPFYRSSGFCTLKSQPHPRLDLLKKEHYWTVNCVQATRGCPFSCDFCSVAQFFGDTYRYRPVDEVIEEVKQLPSGGYFTFVDDNIMGRPAYAKELFQKLAPLKRIWTSQGSLTMAKDTELLKMAAASGCYALFVGIESLTQDNLAAMNKSYFHRQTHSDAAPEEGCSRAGEQFSLPQNGDAGPERQDTHHVQSARQIKYLYPHQGQKESRPHLCGRHLRKEPADAQERRQAAQGQGHAQ
ncbi:MAG: radical family protein [Deltaproteobacteria bacterium]|nr:radical family protein [Deltaproteobacteria bacterium]